MLVYVLSLINLVFLGGSIIFFMDSLREQEPRAPRFGLAGAAFHLALGLAVIFLPWSRAPAGIILGLMALAVLLFLVPGQTQGRSLKGARGYLVGEMERPDERETVFARNRSLKPGSDRYQAYYSSHPEQEEDDAKRRDKGGAVGRPGAIDNGYRPNTSLARANNLLPLFLGPHGSARPDPGSSPAELDPLKASEIVKGYARHIGADLVGICRVDSRHAYSHQGEIFYDNWDDWGRELAEPLPYAIVLATAMDPEPIGAAPHTPTSVETSFHYAKGAFLTTLLAQWLAAMGYRAEAEHHRRYSLLMVPLAVEAGLGELGRQGYLIADRFGARVRLFAVTTDMPLVPDKPVDLGAEEFCEVCLKCAEACPSDSIPMGKRTISNGIERWKLDAESCFDYWGKVGTGCSICLAICPFSRPDHSLHRLVRWTLKRSPLARKVLPHLDNVVYGRRWKPRRVGPWLDYHDSNHGAGQRPWSGQNGGE